MTCHNRADTTLACLDRLFSQSDIEEVKVDVFLVDDGSSDGTAQRVLDRYPSIIVLEGDGTLFWNRGMYRAFAEAIKKGYLYYLWLNDDTALYADTVSVLLRSHEGLGEKGSLRTIIVASTRDSQTKEFTYGGYINKGTTLDPLSLQPVAPENHLVECDTMCGNCVLIPKEVVDLVGNIDSAYVHRWGDVDYGLRARKLGCEVCIAPGYLADCDANPKADEWKNSRSPLHKRIQEMHGIKGLGRKDWMRFVRTHGGALWPLSWVRPYIRLCVNTFKR